MPDRLAIPLYTNPARQKLWRAIGFLVMVGVSILLGYLLDRALHTRASAQRWPAQATTQIRLIKTPRSTQLVEQDFGSLQLLPGTPWSLSEALSWSKREFIVYTNADEVIGLSVDGNVPSSVYASLDNLGWQSLKEGRHTLIIPSAAGGLSDAISRTNFWLLWPAFAGDISLKQPGQTSASIPFHISAKHHLDFPVNMEAFIPKTQLTLPEGAELSGSFTLPPSLAGAWIPKTIPHTFPGLQLLSDHTATSSLDILIGQDDFGPAFVLAANTTDLTLDELGKIATEGLGSQNLSTTVLTIDDLPDSLEIRSPSQINVELDNSDGLEVAVAEDVNGQIFRLTQSSNQLLVSNRAPVIGLVSTAYTSECLRHPAGYLKPAQLLDQLTPDLVFQGQTLFTQLQAAREIAFRKNHLRICW